MPYRCFRPPLLPSSRPGSHLLPPSSGTDVPGATATARIDAIFGNPPAQADGPRAPDLGALAGFAFLEQREAVNPEHADLRCLSDDFLKLWKGLLPVTDRDTFPYVAVRFNQQGGSILHLHPNDFVRFIQRLAQGPGAPLNIVGLYGNRKFMSDSTLRLLFVGLGSDTEAQTFLDRLNDRTCDWRQFPIYTRTGLVYDRDAYGNYISVAPCLRDPISAALGVLPDLSDRRPQGGAPRSSTDAGLGDSSRATSRSRYDDSHSRNDDSRSRNDDSRSRNDDSRSRNDDSRSRNDDISDLARLLLRRG